MPTKYCMYMLKSVFSALDPSIFVFPSGLSEKVRKQYTFPLSIICNCVPNLYCVRVKCDGKDKECNKNLLKLGLWLLGDCESDHPFGITGGQD